MSCWFIRDVCSHPFLNKHSNTQLFWVFKWIKLRFLKSSFSFWSNKVLYCSGVSVTNFSCLVCIKQRFHRFSKHCFVSLVLTFCGEQHSCNFISSIVRPRPNWLLEGILTFPSFSLILYKSSCSLKNERICPDWNLTLKIL